MKGYFFSTVCLLTGFIFFSSPLFGQTRKVDSLLSALSLHSQKDKIRVGLLDEIAKAYLPTDQNLAGYFNDNALALSQEINDSKGLVSALVLKGTLLRMKDQDDSATGYFLGALNRAGLIRDTPSLGIIYMGLGDINLRANHVLTSLGDYRQALKLEEVLQDTAHIIRLLGRIGHLELEQVNQRSLNNRDYSQVFQRFNQEFILSLQNNNQEGIADALDHMGRIYYLQGQSDKALTNFNAALDIFNRLGRLRSLASLHYEIGNLLLAAGKYDSAENYLQLAYYGASQLNDQSLLMKDCLKLSMVKALKGETSEALQFQKIYEFLRDSMDNADQNRNIADLQVKYKSETKDNDIDLLKQQQARQKTIIQQQFYWGMAILCILALVLTVSILLFRTNKSRKVHFQELTRKNQDIEQKNQEVESKNQELEKLNRIKDRILSVISHDIRNPLASMEMMLELMKTGGLTMQEIAMVTDSLSESLTETNNFLNNILEWSKNQMAGIQVKPVMVNLKDAVLDNVRFCRYQAERKNIELVNDVPEKLRVYADKEMIRIVLRNLTTNSIKFTNDNGHIHFGAEKLNGKVKLWVRDDGIGIKPADRPKVFGVDNFSSKGTANEIGTGLGLVLCKEMVESNGGSIWFESEENKGTTFYFTLPNFPKNNEEAAAAEAA